MMQRLCDPTQFVNGGLAQNCICGQWRPTEGPGPGRRTLSGATRRAAARCPRTPPPRRAFPGTRSQGPRPMEPLPWTVPSFPCARRLPGTSSALCVPPHAADIDPSDLDPDSTPSPQFSRTSVEPFTFGSSFSHCNKCGRPWGRGSPSPRGPWLRKVPQAPSSASNTKAEGSAGDRRRAVRPTSHRRGGRPSRPRAVSSSWPQVPRRPTP